MAKGFEEIGEYHVIFWNCQLFAQIFLKVLCKEDIDFGTWNAAQVVRMVKAHIRCAKKSLCAIVAPSVSVSTQWCKEAEKILALKDYMMEGVEELDGEDLMEVSDRAIKIMVWKTLNDQSNEAEMEVLHEPKRSKCEDLLID